MHIASGFANQTVRGCVALTVVRKIYDRPFGFIGSLKIFLAARAHVQDVLYPRTTATNVIAQADIKWC